MKKKIFLDGPRAPRSTIKKKNWGSGDENGVTPANTGIFLRGLKLYGGNRT